MPIKLGASNTVTSIKLGTTDVTRVYRGGLSVWPTTDSSSVAWTGSTSVAWPCTSSDYWFYDELTIRLNPNGTWGAYFWRNGIGGGDPSAIDGGSWATPTVVGIGTNYEAMMEPITITNGAWTTTVAWTSIATALSFGLRTNDAHPVTANTSGQMRIQIRAAGTTTVLSTILINLAITA